MGPLAEKKKVVALVTLIALAGIAAWAFQFYQIQLRGVWPVLRPPPADITTQIPETLPSTASSSPANATGLPLMLPKGFSISIFAKNLPGARVMTFDTFGNLWVSQTSAGKISSLEIDKDTGLVRNQNAVLQNLKNPHGLAFDPANPFTLYYAEEDKISKLPTYSEGEPQKIIDLPAGGNHFTRTLGFGPDGRLYVSIGSSCNVCYESDDRRAKIFSLKNDGSDFKEYARGLRNSVFFIWQPSATGTPQMWATDMGRDLIGDDIPPDEINIVKQGGNYGWPNCYGKNIHDTDFDKNTYFRNPCMEPFEVPSFIDIPAHSAPLGLAFVPQDAAGWPDEYRGNLLVAYHGSWNRSVPTGYKVVRYVFDKNGSVHTTQDFITGWLTPSGALGRPVDILIQPNGTMYLSDDKAGVIYQIQYRG